MNSGKKSSSLRNIWSKKLEGSRSSNSGRTQQRKRHQMMDDVFQPRLVLPADVKEEAPEEQSPDVDQQEPEPLQIKEEQEELWTSQEGEQLTVKEETDTRFPLTAAPIKKDRGPVEEEERRKRMQVVERFQTAPSEEIAALCGSRVISWYQNLNLNMNLFGRSWSDWNLYLIASVQTRSGL
ncbi:uncharacterized protein LOC124861426 isoform X7 [Girardinichthys multiradiatus]|uniref:uncharacterized protein LOC124861426 isoform X7 n=1 Tax=Girardinichthys multiradiatus TaxID=208333 RepID=UPI001FAD52B9|nr:uncharacterized protein LOC124861426 isoform X7 [Girardinichthys multiradiatus]